MYAAYAAGGEDPDACPMSRDHGCRDRGTGEVARGEQRRDVAPRGLGRLVTFAGKPFQILGFEADAEFAVHDGDRCGHGMPWRGE